MPARVHAILVVRPDGRTSAALHLKRTLAALAEQERRVDALTIVLCGSEAGLSELAAASGAESVITTGGGTRFAAATALATPRLTGDAVWLLAQDTAPEPDALARLVGSLERNPSVAYVAPKLVRWDDRTQIVSLGVSMTALGRAVGLADGQLDQGQHDAAEDALAADVRGLLVRTDAWRAMGGLDRALLGADEGLDLGVRARLAGARISLAPTARVAVAGDGVAGPPSGHGASAASRRAIAARTAQLHRRLAYSPALALPFLWLTLVPTALWRTVVHLIAKHPMMVGTEWAATALAVVRWGAVARARGRIRGARRASWSQLAPLRLGRAQLREREEDSGDDGAGADKRRDELRFFVGGGAWLVLAALVLSAAVFPALLAWPVLGGGALEPLGDTVGRLWAEALYGAPAIGTGGAVPADPFAAVMAAIGSLWPWAPSRALVLLWIAALPLAALGGWFAATRVTSRSLLRIVGGIVWMLAPTFLAALTDGRPGPVLVHLLLPWLFYAGAVAPRSWSAAGSASLLLLAVVACAPSLAPALGVLVVLAIVLVVVLRGGRGIPRLIWMLVPTVVVFAPLAWAHLRDGTLLGLFADPGAVWAGPQAAADAGGRALLAAGFPTADPGGWDAFLQGLSLGIPSWWVLLLVAPIAVLALLAPLTARGVSGAVLLGVAALGLATAFIAVGLSVSYTQSQAVPLWPGSALSLAWMGGLGAALVALDTPLAPRLAIVRPVLASVAALGIVVLSAPSLTLFPRGQETLPNGPESTLPAYVAAAGRDDPDIATITLTPQNGGGVATRIVWGASETLGGQSTLLDTRLSPTAEDRDVAALTADLVTSSAGDVVERLASSGIGYVLLAPAADPESDQARAFRLAASTALDQRDGLDAVGTTLKGELWRVTEPVVARDGDSADDSARAAGIAAAQLAVVAAALLLSLPTRASRRAARRTPRIVGGKETR